MKKIYKLAEKGFKFFPCLPTKAPATPNGFYDATNDIEKLETLFNKENFLIGFACGEMNQNIVVLDIDVNKDGDPRSVDELFDELEFYGEIDRTGPQVETPSGGRHFYFKAPKRMTGGTRYFHKSLSIDLQTDGKYVIFPDNENYFVYDSDVDIENFLDNIPDLPEWIVNFKKDKPVQSESTSLVPALPESEIREFRSALSFIPADDRDTWVKVGMALKSTGSPIAFELWHEWSQKSDRYNPNDIESRWKTFKPSEITIASLFHIAKEHGWITTYEKKKDQTTPTIDKIELPDIQKIKKQFEKKPFPDELLRPDGLVGEIIDYVLEKSIIRQPVFALSAALCAVGTLAGRKFQTETGIRTNIYCMNVGGSGSGKEAPRKAIKDLFFAAGCGELASVEDLASDVSIVTELKAPGRESQLFLIDEIGSFLNITKSGGTHLQLISSVLLRLYSNANQVFSGKSYADAEKKVIIQQPNLCLLGTTVPDTLYKGLDFESATNGFMSRIMIFETNLHRPRKTIHPNLLSPPDPILVNKIKSLHKKPVNVNPTGNLEFLIPYPKIVKKNENAQNLLQEFEDYIHDLRNKLEDQHKIEAIYNRTSQMAEQIALIIAVGIDQDNPVITEKEMLYSIKLSKHLADYMNYVVENYMAKNQLEHEVKRILGIVRKFGCISLTELSKQTQNLQGYVRNDVVETLVNSGQIQVDYVGSNNQVTKIFTAI